LEEKIKRRKYWTKTGVKAAPGKHFSRLQIYEKTSRGESSIVIIVLLVARLFGERDEKDSFAKTFTNNQ
jgi:hypothetical protein